MSIFPFARERSNHEELFSYLGKLPSPDRFAGFELPTPVLILPNVFEATLCRRLIDLYDAHGGVESGFMRDVDGKTIAIYDHSDKRRKDYTVADNDLIKQTHRTASSAGSVQSL